MSKRQQIEIDAASEGQQAEVGWGVPLRETRIRRGLSIEDVSNSLHLEVKLIKNIEAEAIDQLPPSSFVKGYLRSYARLLEMEPNALLTAFADVCGDGEPTLTQVIKYREASSKDAAPRYATWLVVAVLVLSLGAWWWSKLMTSATEGDEVTTSTSEPETVANEVLPNELITEPVLSDETFDQEAPIAAEESSSEVPVVEAPVPAEPVLSTLKFEFKEDSWVEVNDAQGKRLYVNMARAGQTKLVEGEAPFKVLLGNAPGVSVEFNGELYDQTKHNRKGVARFTLGE